MESVDLHFRHRRISKRWYGTVLGTVFTLSKKVLKIVPYNYLTSILVHDAVFLAIIGQYKSVVSIILRDVIIVGIKNIGFLLGCRTSYYLEIGYYKLIQSTQKISTYFNFKWQVCTHYGLFSICGVVKIFPLPLKWFIPVGFPYYLKPIRSLYRAHKSYAVSSLSSIPKYSYENAYNMYCDVVLLFKGQISWFSIVK